MYGTINAEWKSHQDRLEGFLTHCFHNEPNTPFRSLVLESTARLINERRSAMGLPEYTSQDFIDLVEGRLVTE